jgi:hypothetical protein
MAAHRWRGHADGGSEFARPLRRLAEQLHDLAASWVC